MQNNSLWESGEADLNQQNETLPPCTRINRNVHLGRNILLQSTVFDTIYRKKKDTIFMKEMATAVFGDEILINSSVTGITCNRKREPAKPALVPTKLMAIQGLILFYHTDLVREVFSRWIRQKLLSRWTTSLMRKFRTSEGDHETIERRFSLILQVISTHFYVFLVFEKNYFVSDPKLFLQENDDNHHVVFDNVENMEDLVIDNDEEIALVNTDVN
ncbi:hypothetical protein FQR65_LT18060 [Abscondita terminalis]|nr:hypothetical protein FQR65_LT18060 [Abscondita terminalis]